MRPNILLITSDQHRFDHLGCMGTPGFVTPNLDRMAREGVHFNRAYTPCPICTPTRVSLLTGQYPSRHGAYSIGVTLKPFPTVTLPSVLSAAGYHTALFGKHHFVRRDDEIEHISGMKNPPPEFWETWNGPYVGFDEFQANTGHTINNVPEAHYRLFLERAGVDYKPWFHVTRDDYSRFETGLWEIPAEYHDSSWIAQVTNDYLHRRAETGQPWFCWASFQDPHEPMVCPDPWYSQVNPDELRLYEDYREGEFDDRHAIYRCMRESKFGRFDDGNGFPSSFGDFERKGIERDSLRATAGMVNFMDDRIGAIFKTLEETGQLENTLVIYTTDHGEMHGHHGLWGKGGAAYEGCQRVPLLAWGPGLIPATGKTEALANLVDLPRTFLNFAGVEEPTGLQGVDLGPVLRRETESVQDAVTVELRPTYETFYQQTLVTASHKLVVYKDTDDGELYDLDADPDQYRNLWSDAASRDTRDVLVRRLVRLNLEREAHSPRRVSFA
ncbi:MAG: sulfatase-like hydrolase/transferase [Opitutaceae bacterium]